MKINKHFAVKLIATVIFVAATSSGCGEAGKGSKHTNATIAQIKPQEKFSPEQIESLKNSGAQIKPEEMFSQEQRESLKTSIATMDADSVIEKLLEVFDVYNKKIMKEFPKAETDMKLAKEVGEIRLIPYFSELQVIAIEGIKDKSTLSRVLDVLVAFENEVKSTVSKL